MAASSPSSSLFGIREEDQNLMKQHSSSTPTSSTAAATLPAQKRKRNQPGTPNPDAEVIALSPKTLMATNRFICEVCNKGFQREQNLQLHRRGHNLPWKLKQKTTKEPKRKVYLCPEPTCVHHDPSRALGDLTGIKKHFSRKHGEKKWKCDKCSKRYAVQSDWKAHSKTCGTREYRCDCGTLFSRRDSFITHRAFCDALAQESERHQPHLSTLYGGGTSHTTGLTLYHHQLVGPHNINNSSAAAGRAGHFDHRLLSPPSGAFFTNQEDDHSILQHNYHELMQFSDHHQNNNSSASGGAGNLLNLPFVSNNSNAAIGSSSTSTNLLIQSDHHQYNSNGQGASTLIPSLYSSQVENNSHHGVNSHMSATALLQKAAQMGSTTSSNYNTSASLLKSFGRTTSTTPIPASFRSIFGGSENDQNNFQDLMNSFAAGGGSSSLFGGGSDRLTRDFLGIGQIVRSRSGVQQRSHIEHMSSMDSDTNVAAPSTQSFGGAGASFQ